MIIRPLKAEDRPALHSILNETAVFTFEEVDVALELIDIALNKPEQKDYMIYTGLEGENVVGYYCAGPTPMTDGTYDLYWIAVAPATHRKGYGKKLLEHVESLVLNEKGRLIIAETSSQSKYDNTRNFYIKNRYAELARIKDYYRMGDDMVVYGKYLPQSGALK